MRAAASSRGLRWSAIDFEQGFVRIDSAVVSTDEDNSGKRTGARLETKDTKTHAERFLALDAGTAKALREMRRRHVEAALACGVPYPADAYVWRENVEGTRPVLPDRFSYAWRQIDKAVDDGAHVRLHDLRHFHGPMLVGAGVPLPRRLRPSTSCSTRSTRTPSPSFGGDPCPADRGHPGREIRGGSFWGRSLGR